MADAAAILLDRVSFDPAGDFEGFLKRVPARWVVYLMVDERGRPVQLLCVKNLQASLNYRWQPYGVFSLDANFNQIALPDPYKTSNIYLIGPRMDFTLTRSVFFTTLMQYNSQYQNMSINSRFQWRFKPVSDLFIVYTDNYFYSFDQPAQNLSPKNRALVVKLTYWFNL